MTLATLLDKEGHRPVNPACGFSIFIVVNHERRSTVLMIGIGENVFVHPTAGCLKIVKSEAVHISKNFALVKQWENHCLMMADQISVGSLIPVWAVVFHSIFLRVSFNLSVPEHGQARHGGHDGTNAKIFIALPELHGSSLFIGIVHKIDEPFEYLGVKFKRVLHHLPVFGIFFITQ